MFEVEFYEDERGTSDARDFVVNMADPKLQAKIIGSLQVLAEKGNRLREPYTKYLEDGIFELRCKAGNNSARLLFFYCEGKIVVVTNGFMKQTRKTPRKEIRLAKRRRAEYMSRKGLRDGNA